VEPFSVFTKVKLELPGGAAPNLANQVLSYQGVSFPQNSTKIGT
jgi:hypothetical protein